MNAVQPALATLRLIMLGPPGAGKGTQAKILEERFGAAQISTGDILRRHRSEGTALGKEAQAFMDAGALVPDELIVAMMAVELAGRRSFILDGFPRTVAQAGALDALLERLQLPLTGVVLFDADRETLIRRVSSRWTNPRSGRVYNAESHPPRVAGIDDEDGGPLVQRPDDNPETAAVRLETYEAQTAPLVSYYRSRPAPVASDRTALLVRVDGLQPIAHVTATIVSDLAIAGAA